MPDKQLVKVFVALCDEAGTPLADSLKKAALRGDWLTIVQTKVDPRSYKDARTYYCDSVVANFLRKAKMTVKGVNPAAITQEKFWENERVNHGTNLRLLPFCENSGFNHLDDLRVASFLDAVKRKVGWILGPLPLDLGLGRFGPGSTYDLLGENATIMHKLASAPSLTNEMVDFVPLLEQSAWFRGLSGENQRLVSLSVVRGNRFTTVDKTALVKRGICIEGTFNVFAQLSIGQHIADRLRLIGLDKTLSQDRHRFLAWLASITNELFTMDLSDASDLIATNFVRACMPNKWYDLLCATRSPFTQIKRKGIGDRKEADKWVKLEKFSSMGNGWTFELETLLFLAVAWVVAEEAGIPVKIGSNLSVYGDDIIAPTEIADTLRSVLTFLGCKVNERKTFVETQFKESCGGDYFAGMDVSPFYVKNLPTQPADWMVIANGIRRLGRQHRAGWTDWPRFHRAWLSCLSAIPIAERRLRGPEYLGDSVIHDDYERWAVNKQVNTRMRYFPGETGSYYTSVEQLPVDGEYWETPDRRKFVKALVPINPVIELSKFDSWTVFAAALYGVPSSGVVPRKGGKDAVTGYRKKWLAVGL